MPNATGTIRENNFARNLPSVFTYNILKAKKKKHLRPPPCYYKKENKKVSTEIAS